MRRIKVAAAALNQTPMDWDSNVKNVRDAISAAKAAQVQLLCLPELCVTGYGCEDAFFSGGLLDVALQIVQDEIAPFTESIAVAVGLPVIMNNALFNTACMLADRKILGFTAKQHLAGDGVHYEQRWFKPWPSGVRTHLSFAGQQYPFGDVVYEIDGVKIGFEICEDAWVANRPARDFASKGIDIILNPSASHFAFGKHALRRRYVLEGSRSSHCGYVYSNLLGCEAGRIIYDGDCLIAENGNLLSESGRFKFEQVVVTSAILDLEKVRLSKAKLVSYEPGLDLDDSFVKADTGILGSLSLEVKGDKVPVLSQELQEKDSEFYLAVTLGLFDYLRKSRSNGFIVSLSGGADSSSVSCLVALMVERGVAELGFKEFLARFEYSPLSKATDVAELKRDMLTCVYQSTRNNSSVTQKAASALAEALGATFYEFKIDDLVDAYVKKVEDESKIKLAWDEYDIALQNVQARTRVPGIWLLANKDGKLLLTTSNRSEAAVGYATMDGDTAGGLNPIGGVDKAFLRSWLRVLEKQGLPGVEALSVLALVNEQQPTAELRPLSEKQTDEADLMPYEILEAIEELAIGDKKLPLEVFLKLQGEFPSVEEAQLKSWIAKFFRLWSINQWKRERYAPCFHLDDKNLDPKTWCRFPIFSGSYVRELKALFEWEAA